jgi:hypothetical protein
MRQDRLAPRIGVDLTALRRRLRYLAQDTASVQGPPPEAEDVESLQWRRAEASFQYALYRRTWWRLKPAERDAIRSLVIAEHPEYAHAPNATAFEADCIIEMHHLLAGPESSAVA